MSPVYIVPLNSLNISLSLEQDGRDETRIYKVEKTRRGYQTTLLFILLPLFSMLTKLFPHPLVR